MIAVIEMSQSRWLVAAVVPGVKRQLLKKLQADEEALLKLLYRWRTEAGQTGRSRLRGRTRRVLAGALAADARCRGLRYPSRKYCGVTRTPARKD